MKKLITITLILNSFLSFAQETKELIKTDSIKIEEHPLYTASNGISTIGNYKYNHEKKMYEFKYENGKTLDVNGYRTPANWDSFIASPDQSRIIQFTSVGMCLTLPGASFLRNSKGEIIRKYDKPLSRAHFLSNGLFVAIREEGQPSYRPVPRSNVQLQLHDNNGIEKWSITEKLNSDVHMLGLAISNDEKYIALNKGSTISIYNKEGDFLFESKTEIRLIRYIMFLNDGRLLVNGGYILDWQNNESEIINTGATLYGRFTLPYKDSKLIVGIWSEEKFIVKIIDINNPDVIIASTEVLTELGIWSTNIQSMSIKGDLLTINIHNTIQKTYKISND